MSGGFGLPVLNIAGMLGGIGTAYDQGFERAQKKTALTALGAQLQSGDYSGAAQTAFQAGDPGTGIGLLKLGQQAQQSRDAKTAFDALGSYMGGGAGNGVEALGVPRSVSDASGSGAGGSSPRPLAFAGGTSPMRMPGSGGENETKFVDALKAGGLTNPYGLGAMAAYANHESRYSSNNINGSWPDPSESGAPGTSGGILSWRGDRLANMQRATAGAPDPVVAQAKYALVENPDLTLALQRAKSPEEANALMARAWKFAGWDRSGGENAARLSSTRAYVTSLNATGGLPSARTAQASASAPGPVAYADDEAGVQALEQRMGMMPPAPASRQVASADPQADVPTPGAQDAAFYVPPGSGVANPAPGLSGAGTASARPMPVRSMPSSSSNAPAPVGGAGGRVMTMPGEAQASDDASSDQAQLSAQAPAHIEQAGLPRAAAQAVNASPAGSQQRIGVLMRLASMPGLSEGQAGVVKMLLANEIDQTKLPDTAKQYLFARSPVGGGFDGTYAEFVGKSRDEGAKVSAQLKAREDWLVAHGMDPNEAGNRAWLMGGKTTTGHVLKPGDILAGPSGQTLAQNASAASSMPDETANFLAERVLAGDTRALIGLGRGAQGAENLAKIQGLVAQKAREQGIDPTDIQQRAADAMGLGAQARSLGTSAGRMAAAAYEAQGAIQLGLEASAAVPRTSFVPLNRAYQMVQSNTGDPALKQFVAANNTIINTFARAISPTGSPTVSDKEHAREMLSTADSPEAYAAVLQQMQKEIDMAHKAPEQARRGLEAERQAAKRGGVQQPERYTTNPLSSPPTQPQPQPQPVPQQYHEGQTASGPGGQKVIFSRGQWVPLNPAPSTTASPNAGGAL